MAEARAERDEDMKYLMLGEEGYLDRPSGTTWYEASAVMDIAGHCCKSCRQAWQQRACVPARNDDGLEPELFATHFRRDRDGGG